MLLPPLKAQFYTLVRGVGGLGIRMLTFDTETTLYAEDQGIQVPMVLDHDYIPHTYKIVGTQFCDTLSHPSFRRIFRVSIKHTINVS